MASHNLANIVGYLLQHPRILNEGKEGEEKALFYVRTIRRDADDVAPEKFEDIMLMYDGAELMSRVKVLQQFDVIWAKGVFNMVNVNKQHRCPSCGHIDVKQNGTSPFIYPIFLWKLDNIRNSYTFNSELPDAILAKHFKEVSNYMLCMGYVCTDPEMIGTEKHPVCRYKIAINRKYFIRTEPDTKADYVWVYSYGEQAESDFKHLEVGSDITVDGYYHARTVQVPTQCSECGETYKYGDYLMDYVPYAVEYHVYKTDEDIAREEEMRARGIISA